MRAAGLRSLARHFRSAASLVAFSLALAVVQSVLLVPIGLLVRRLFDRVIPAGDTRTLVAYGGLILALYVASALFGLATRFVALRATKAAITRLRAELLDRLHRVRQAFYDRADVGRLHATVVHDTERLDVMSNALVAQLLPALLVGLALASLLAVLSPTLFLVLFALLPAVLLAARVLGRGVRAATRRYQRAYDTFSADTGLALRAVHLTKAHAAEDVRLARSRDAVAELGEAGRRMAWLQATYTLVNGGLAAVATVVVLIVGGAAVARGHATLGELLSFFAVLALLRARISTALTAAPHVLAGLESLVRLERLLALDEPEPYRGRRPPAFRGGLRLEGVRFSYGRRPVLREASLELDPGVHVGLVGPNGAGKSTIVSLLLGLYRPDAGRVLADGEPYDEIDLRSVRRRLGVVLQDPLILPATVRDNIAFGLDDPDEAEIELAAELAAAASFVRELPDGFDTDVGAEGVRLSAGQRQRLAIARALVRRPALLVLDEPATYVDPPTAERLLATLTSLPWRPGLLVIAHDEAQLPPVDRLYRLEDGVTELVHAAAGAARGPA